MITDEDNLPDIDIGDREKTLTKGFINSPYGIGYQNGTQSTSSFILDSLDNYQETSGLPDDVVKGYEVVKGIIHILEETLREEYSNLAGSHTVQ